MPFSVTNGLLKRFSSVPLAVLLCPVAAVLNQKGIIIMPQGYYYEVSVNGFVVNQYPHTEQGKKDAMWLRDEVRQVLIDFGNSYKTDVYLLQGGWIQVSTEQVFHRVATLFTADYRENLASREDPGNSQDYKSFSPGIGRVPAKGRAIK